ncbi:MAG: nuclear transport factor 2 family protein [Pyrinomonadaceae bacterium]
MARKLISTRGGISIALAFLAAATLLWIASARTIGSTAKDKDTAPQWDEKASKELTMALHHTHEVANAGDIKALKRSYIGDDALVTFEMDPDNATPVALRSKKEIDAHLDRVSQGLSQEGTLFLDGPKMNCRATATFGVCTEECTIRLKKADGTEQVDHFFGSGTAIKTGGEWKWVQWHMSVGGPRENVKSGKVEAASHGHQ